MGQTILVAVVLVAIASFLLESSGTSLGGGISGALGGVVTATPLNAKISALAQAIATAEGFGIPGAVPTRANNPGDLVNGDIGLGVANSAGVTIYASVSDGWGALYHQLNLIFTGQSNVYSSDFDFATFARLWTGGDNFSAWAANVVSMIGANTSSTLADWYNS